jgi:hypothetical protein
MEAQFFGMKLRRRDLRDLFADAGCLAPSWRRDVRRLEFPLRRVCAA